MLKFKYSSPGKIILFGEHAVVYGHAAVATAISKRITLKVEMIKSLNTEININDDGKITSFNPYILPNKSDSENCRDKMLRFAFKHFPKNHTLNLEITTNFPVSNGLGSSASFCALIAAASSRCCDEKITKDILYTRAVQLENFFHRNPSGLDPATVIYGGSIKMENKQFSKSFSFDENLPLLIVDSGVKGTTLTSVTHVANLCQKDPSIYKPILQILGELSKKFCTSKIKSEAIIKYFPIAQNLLSSLDLSCKEIDDIVRISKQNDLAAKISGGGMGGVVLVSGKNLKDKFDKFSKYEVIHAEIGAEGLHEE